MISSSCWVSISFVLIPPLATTVLMIPATEAGRNLSPKFVLAGLLVTAPLPALYIILLFLDRNQLGGDPKPRKAARLTGLMEDGVVGAEARRAEPGFWSTRLGSGDGSLDIC